MLYIFLLLIAVGIGAAVLLSDNGSERVKDEYCRLECQERKIRDHSICC